MAEKYAHLMKLAMGRYPAVNVEVGLSVLVDACSYYFDKNDAFCYLKGGGKISSDDIDKKNAIYIADLNNDGDYLKILLVRGDPQRALPSFVNLQTRIVKPVEPEDSGDVPGASAHIIISKQAIAAGGDQGRHRMIMEKATGLSKTLAKDFLVLLMGRYAEEFPEKFVAEKRRTKTKEKPEKISYRPTCRFNPQQNASLKKDLESGKIGGFKLVRGVRSFTGEASEAKIQKLNVQLAVQIAPTEDFASVKNAISAVRTLFGDVNFEAMNLELIDDDGHHQTTQMLEIDHLDEADMRYCRTVPLISGDNLVDCYPELQKEVVAASITTISNEKYWK